MRVYFDFRDWWIGYYRGDRHHYVCLLPTLVIRWPRTARAALDRETPRSENGGGPGATAG